MIEFGDGNITPPIFFITVSSFGERLRRKLHLRRQFLTGLAGINDHAAAGNKKNAEISVSAFLN